VVASADTASTSVPARPDVTAPNLGVDATTAADTIHTPLPTPDAPPDSPLALGNWLDTAELAPIQRAIRDRRFVEADAALTAWLETPAFAADPRVWAARLVRDMVRVELLRRPSEGGAAAPNAGELVASLRTAEAAFAPLASELGLDIAEVQLLSGEGPAALEGLDQLLATGKDLAPSLFQRAQDLRLRVQVALGHQSVIAPELAAAGVGELSADALAIYLETAQGAAVSDAKLAFLTRFAGDSRAIELFDAFDLDSLEPAQRLAIGEAMLAAGRYKSARRAVESLTGARDPDATACAAGLVHGLSLDRATGRKNYRGQDAVFSYLSRLAARCDGDVGAWATFIAGRNRTRALSRQKTPKKKKAVLKDARRLLQEHIDRYGTRTTVDDAYVLLAGLEEDEAKADALRWLALERHSDGDMAGDLAWDLIGPDVRAGNWESLVVDLDRIFKLVPAGPPSRHGGRFAYWRARALAGTGKDAAAQIVFRDILSSFPLSYYAVLSLSQLCGVDAECGLQRLNDAAGELAEPTQNQAAPVHLITKERWTRLWNNTNYRRAVAWARLAGTAHTDDALFAGRVQDALRDVPQPVRPDKAGWFWARAEVLQLAGAYARASGEARSLEDGGGLGYPRGADLEAWRAAFPRPFEDLVRHFATERGISPAWIWAVARVESNFNPQVVSWANAIGLMQIIPTTATYLARGTDIDPSNENLKKPEIALELGTLYLSRLLDRHIQIPLASAGYNAGGGAVSRWRKEFGGLELDRFVESIPYGEAHNYARSVTQTMARYMWIYEQKPLLLQVSGPAASTIDAPSDEPDAGSEEAQPKEEGAPTQNDGGDEETPADP